MIIKKFKDVKENEKFWFMEDGKKSGPARIKVGPFFYEWGFGDVVIKDDPRFCAEIEDVNEEVIVEVDVKSVLRELEAWVTCRNHTCDGCLVKRQCEEYNNYGLRLLKEIEEILSNIE